MSRFVWIISLFDAINFMIPCWTALSSYSIMVRVYWSMAYDTIIFCQLLMIQLYSSIAYDTIISVNHLCSCSNDFFLRKGQQLLSRHYQSLQTLLTLGRCLLIHVNCQSGRLQCFAQKLKWWNVEERTSRILEWVQCRVIL
jgi:hypothetical protein